MKFDSSSVMCIHTKEKKRKMEMKYIKELEKFAFFVFERKKDDIRVRFRFLSYTAARDTYILPYSRFVFDRALSSG